MSGHDGLGRMEFATVLAASVHDMKNSLGMLLAGMEELTERCAGACPSSPGLRRLRYEGQRITSQLVRLLALYRIEGEGYALNVAEHDAHECLDAIRAEHADLLALQGISIEFECPEETYWCFDRGLVEGVVGSVINNAYRYARDRLRIAAEVEEGFLRITVEDNGPGYPPAMLVDSDPTLQPLSFTRSSSGLGLYFAHLIAGLHRSGGRRGRVTLDNHGIDGGGRFALMLP